MLSVTLTGSGPPVPLVGAPVVWTASSNDQGSSPVYQFDVGPVGGPLQVVQDYSLANSFTWNPIQEGTYDIQVNVKSGYSAMSGEFTSTTYKAKTRVTGTSAVVTAMSNPLVALYSAPPSSGSSMYVQFAPVGSSSWTSTSTQPILPGKSTNFIIAGMLPSTTYNMRDVLDDGTTSASIQFTTGALPSSLIFPTFTQPVGPTSSTDFSQDEVFHAGLPFGEPANYVSTLATDLSGNIIWYYDPVANNFPDYATELVPGGTVFLLGGQSATGAGSYQSIQQVDLAGDMLHETNINAMNAELAARGMNSITDFNHEITLLPNGDIAVLATTVRTIDVNGTPTVYDGDMVLVLDQNFQLTWAWDAFDWLSTSRLPTLGEGPGDWLHANSIAWSPEDDNLIVSLRAQDWVIKIDYDNGAGDGHVIWRLGQGGDFTLVAPPGTQSPWFSHQHDVQYINDNTIILFDDGNVRQASNPDADSRGQEWLINEQTMTATLVINVDLGNYSQALGSAQVLPNGNLDFNSGYLGTGTNNYGQSIEVTPSGAQTFVQQMTGLEYRSYFESSLYVTPPVLPDLQIVGDGDPAWSTTGNWTLGTNPGYDGNVHYAAAGNGTSTSTWTFSVIPGQTYNVGATWTAFANRATDAPFTIISGGTLLGTATVDQQFASGSTDDGATWQSLGTFVAIGPTLTVTLSNLANGYVIADAIRLERLTGQQIVDDGNAGWLTAGTWTLGTNPGYQGDVHYAAAGNGSSTSTWTFSVVPGQSYEVAATWTAQSNRATNAPFTIASGGSNLGSVAVNEQVAPSGFTDASGTWQTLGTFDATGSTLTVTLSNLANGFVIADAIRIQPVTEGTDSAGDIRTPGGTSGGGGLAKSVAARAGSGGSLPSSNSVAAGGGSSQALSSFTVVATTAKDSSAQAAQQPAGPAGLATIEPTSPIAIPGLSSRSRSATTQKEPVILRGTAIRRAPLSSYRRTHDGSIV